MTYFRELPNIEYQNFLNSTGSDDYILIKNIFMRAKLRDDLQNVFTIFNKYIIKEDERPDQIANKLYGDPTLDWLVRVVAQIINMPNDYPLNSQQLYQFCVEKYGEEGMFDTRQFITKEVRDAEKKLVLPGGLVVAGDFTIPNPKDPVNTLNPVIPVTNFDYERQLNDDKREIYVLKREYVGQAVNDFREISKYGFNSEFVNNTTIRVENSKAASP